MTFPHIQFNSIRSFLFYFQCVFNKQSKIIFNSLFYFSILQIRAAAKYNLCVYISAQNLFYESTTHKQKNQKIIQQNVFFFFFIDKNEIDKFKIAFI